MEFINVDRKLALSEISIKLGRFLSNLQYVLSTLVVYVALGFLTFFLLAIQSDINKTKAGFIAYEMSTGGDPYNFLAEVQHHSLLWSWLLVFHVISWLIVPILAATAVDGAFRSWEQKRLRLESKLMAIMITVITAHADVSPENARRIAQEAKAAMDREFD